MSQPRFLFLIGMPAVGKSYWAEQIADAYPLQSIDLDRYIAEHERASIPALFAKYGEQGFRDREQKYLKQIIGSATSDTIIATGGGTPCFLDNIELMKAHGTVVYLHAETAYLLGNLEKSTETRPLLNGKIDTATYLDTLLKKRINIYHCAHHILPAENISLTTFDKIITTCISRA
jgi:shikimate kinase